VQLLVATRATLAFLMLRGAAHDPVVMAARASSAIALVLVGLHLLSAGRPNNFGALVCGPSRRFGVGVHKPHGTASLAGWLSLTDVSYIRDIRNLAVF